MREREVEQYLRNQVKKAGGKAYKFVSPGNDGVPDRIVILPNGKIFFVEVKAPGKRPTKIQERKMEELTILGQQAYVVDCKNEVDKLLISKGVIV